MITEEIRKARQKGIGSSDLAAIAGLSQYRTPLDVYHEKLGMRADDPDNQYTYWGNKMEDPIAQEYEIRKGVKVIDPNEMITHPEYPFMLANVDRLIDDGKGILECKTASAYISQEWGEIGSDQIPDAYLLQAAHQSKVYEHKGIEYVDIAVLIGGNDFRIYRYLRNTILEERITNIASKFWNNHVIPHIPPAPKNINDLLFLYPQDNGNKVQATEEALLIIDALKNISGEINMLSEKEKEYKNQVRALIANSYMLVDTEGRKIATWKSQSTNRFDTTTFKKEYPDMYKDFCKTSETRVLRIV